MGSNPSVSTKHEKPLIKPIGGFFLYSCGFSGALIPPPATKFRRQKRYFGIKSVTNLSRCHEKSRGFFPGSVMRFYDMS